MTAPRGNRRTVVGTVVSAKMQKTIKVSEERLVKHARYGKYIRRATYYRAHDEQGEARLGDRVEIVFGRPMSKTKTWRLVRVLGSDKLAGVTGGEDPQAASEEVSA